MAAKGTASDSVQRAWSGTLIAVTQSQRYVIKGPQKGGVVQRGAPEGASVSCSTSTSNRSNGWTVCMKTARERVLLVNRVKPGLSILKQSCRQLALLQGIVLYLNGIYGCGLGLRSLCKPRSFGTSLTLLVELCTGTRSKVSYRHVRFGNRRVEDNEI